MIGRGFLLLHDLYARRARSHATTELRTFEESNRAGTGLVIIGLMSAGSGSYYSSLSKAFWVRPRRLFKFIELLFNFIGAAF
jgi:hypothetical protein